MLATNVFMVEQDEALGVAVNHVRCEETVQEVVADLLSLDLALVSAVDGFIEEDSVGADYVHGVVSVFAVVV